MPRHRCTHAARLVQRVQREVPWLKELQQFEPDGVQRAWAEAEAAATAVRAEARREGATAVETLERGNRVALERLAEAAHLDMADIDDLKRAQRQHGYNRCSAPWASWAQGHVVTRLTRLHCSDLSALHLSRSHDTHAA